MREGRLGGILVALVTPFTDDSRQLDENTLTALVDHLVGAGVHGVVAAGTTGEFTTLTVDERRRLAALTVDAVDGRVPVVVGTGSLVPAETIAYAEHAQELGADAVMITPPFYDPLRFSELIAFLEGVADTIDIPIVYYHVPGATGLQLTPAQLAELGSVPQVDYIKDTSGDAIALTEMLTARRGDITTFNGWDTLTFTGLALGATGSVWGTANLVPDLAVRLWDAVTVRGDLEEGRRLWSVLWPICDLLEANNYASGVKAGLEVLGRPAGPVRPPSLPLAPDARNRLTVLLEAARTQVPVR